ncbi:MAG: 4Fe-4S cluster-binding domain-containing protein, partial [Spirochaetales bacterium]|nr:4Fe-4S cluster-binding domain-containing protein [Spirochaetales bacterium]
CRHCFRRDFIQSNSNEFTNRDLEDACAYLGDNPNVHEILLSGGDPLTLKPARLEYLLSKIKECRPDIIIRIGTRVPIVDPEKITIEVTDILKKAAPVWLSLQCNHPDELTNEVKIATSLLNQSGIHLLNQSVLLKDINDSLPVLKKLSHKLVDFNIKPYYIFQGDLAKGTSHFRVPISKGLLLMKELRSEVSGIAMPLYAVDIPSGGGKIPLNMDYIDKIDNDFYYLKNSSGFVGKYPREEL